MVLPERPGRGGRNQALALALAREIAGTEDLVVVVGGTDGTDGPTDAAGGVVDGGSWGAGRGRGPGGGGCGNLAGQARRSSGDGTNRHERYGSAGGTARLTETIRGRDCRCSGGAAPVRAERADSPGYLRPERSREDRGDGRERVSARDRGAA
ncbi:MOFRL family protein [Jhaorihella thermophila]